VITGSFNWSPAAAHANDERAAGRSLLPPFLRPNFTREMTDVARAPSFLDHRADAAESLERRHRTLAASRKRACCRIARGQAT